MHRDYLFPIFLKRSLRLREKVWLTQGQVSHLCHTAVARCPQVWGKEDRGHAGRVGHQEAMEMGPLQSARRAAQRS